MKMFFLFGLNNRLLVGVLGLLVVAGGLYSYKQLPVDAFPDVTPSLVQVFTETEGLAPEEVETFITYPIETAMNGLPHLREVRSTSNFGLSVVNIYFEDGTDIYFARQLVGERLNQARGQIPDGFGVPEMGPIATGLGQILFYVLEDESHSRSAQEMREIQDWLVKFHLQTVQGVTEVLSLGGQVKQFQIRVRPDDLLRFDLGIQDVIQAVKANNSNTGAQFLVKNSEEYIIRSIGLVEKIGDLGKVVLKSQDGTPVYLDQIAEVVTGGEIRRGLATMNGNGEVVVGMVLKLIGANTSNVITGVKQKLKEINRVLPEGVRVVPYYNQAALVSKCVQTVVQALLTGILLVVGILLVFMGGWRASAVVALSIPFSIFFAFILMKWFGISANLMSLGGLAIAIGMMVDAAIVMVENVDRRLKLAPEGSSRLVVVAEACSEVGKPILFAIAIIIVVFLPLFSLQGVEGKTFKPLAKTVSLAMLGSLLFALLLAPAISFFLMGKSNRGPSQNESKETWLLRWGQTFYRPLVSYFVHHRFLSLGFALGIFFVGIFILPRLGSEFVPRLDEGDLLIRATMAPSISLDEAKKTMLLFEKRLMNSFPEVTQVVSRVGRGEVGAHADPVNSAEAFVALRPVSEWTQAESPQELYAKISESLETFPGARFNVTQPIAAAVDELLTGTKAELAIKIYGPDMEVLQEKAIQIEKVIREVPGAADVQRDQVTGTPQLLIRIDRQAIARYGINVEDIQTLLHSAVGGEKAGEIFEGNRRFDINVRFENQARSDLHAISNVLIPSPDGALIPLDQLANIQEMIGPRQITREDNQRFMTVQCNVRNRDIGHFVEEGQDLLSRQLELPSGYFVEWGGQFELQQEANRRLALVVPITLLAILLLLFMSFGSFKSTFLILLNIPLALVGGAVALWLTGQNLSVPSFVGFIALFGIALENGMVLVSQMNQLVGQGISKTEAAISGACLRLRPVLMTAATTALGLLPLLMSSGTGSEVQRPLATVVAGGLMTSLVLTLLVLPALFTWFINDEGQPPQVRK